MRVTGKACHILADEGSSPPLPYVEVSDTEGAVLIGLGHAVEVTDDSDLDANAEAEAAAAAEAEAEARAKADAEAAEAEALAAAAAEAEAAANAEAEALATANAEAAAARAATIADAVLLVEPDGLEAKGPRKGKPTIAAVESIAELSDVTAEEIDAALAAHEAA